ncbi:MAG: Rrf2 family transcriptional regulator [Phycisphaerales bacterium]|nr:Rrf2 family transcriptional regulator [Phycisphaerales bacterium]
MKLFSDACEYGLRATVWLGQRVGETHKVREIAAGTHASAGYLVKVLQRLAKAGILSAQRGSQGGFTLERAPEALTVLDVINAVDPIERIETCPLGLDSHGAHLCPLHRRIDDAMALIEDGFGAVTIAELINEPTRSRLLCNGLRVDPSPAAGKEA